MRKAVSLLLCIVLSFSTIAYASPQDYVIKSSDFEVIEREVNAEGKIVKEVSISKDSGTIYYFEMNDDRIISMDMVNNGKINVFMRNIENQTTLATKQSIKPVFTGSFQVNDKLEVSEGINYLTNLSKSIQNNKTSLKAITSNDFGINTNKISAKSADRSSITSTIYSMLVDEVGPEQSSTFVYGKDYRNEYGALYSSKSFSIGVALGWDFVIGITVTALGAYFGLPATALKPLLGELVTLVGGVWTLTSPLRAEKYQGVVTRAKKVKVNNVVSHTSTFITYHYVLSFSNGNMTPDFDPGEEIKSIDYDLSNSYLVEKGIDNYLSNQN